MESVTGELGPEGQVRLVGATSIADGHRAGPNPESARVVPRFLVLLEGETDAADWVEQASVSVTDGWAMGSDVGLQPVASPETMRVFADPGHIDETVFAWIEAVTLRYSVTGPGFIARFDARVGSVDEMENQFRDSLGAVIASRSVAPWPAAELEE